MIAGGVTHFRSALTSLTLRPVRSRHECLALLLFMWVPMARMREPKPARTGRMEGRRKEEGARKEGGKEDGGEARESYYQSLSVAFS